MMQAASDIFLRMDLGPSFGTPILCSHPEERRLGEVSEPAEQEALASSSTSRFLGPRLLGDLGYIGRRTPESRQC